MDGVSSCVGVVDCAVDCVMGGVGTDYDFVARPYLDDAEGEVVCSAALDIDEDRSS